SRLRPTAPLRKRSPRSPGRSRRSSAPTSSRSSARSTATRARPPRSLASPDRPSGKSSPKPHPEAGSFLAVLTAGALGGWTGIIRPHGSDTATRIRKALGIVRLWSTFSLGTPFARQESRTAPGSPGRTRAEERKAMRAAVRKLRIEDVEKLQALVVEHFDAIEPGLTVLDARLLLGHATIDVIGVDSVGALVLGAVGFSANEDMLLKAVEAYSWCLEYPEALVRLYPSCQLSEDRPPRLLFVVERMPDAFHRKIKQLGFPEVDCVEFRHLEFDGVPTVYFESLLRLRRTIGARAVQPESTSAVVAPASTENVITMTGSAPRAAGVKLPKLGQPSTEATVNSPRATERPVFSREPAAVVSMVSRQTAVAAPWVERPRPAEPVALREPEPLVTEPVGEAVVETVAALEPVGALLEPVAIPEIVAVPEAIAIPEPVIAP